ncbi:pentatricopeptide repeat-containing protein At2g33680-like isoform X2 [Selaginella moellendorffii]|uniref:pentatricopeptide repeat-containing protein At2g33680-like isoform X2 n=1 Tax=Selaginella moellendorffii TaxID=88036 RepID=UPI000D1C3DFC|nr:pentatricopeptide repeat-containing protein At2g33680-like isoform X2 [Selaginella moellendorffii]|eukprot:XP_024541774.1 pentatricopeptide repeat-containing protein At2g33680-like isoform X2 [Selaginella moellendorffii]
MPGCLALRILRPRSITRKPALGPTVDCGEITRERSSPSDIAGLIAALKACGRDRDLRRGRVLHAGISERGDDANVAVANTVVDMYGKCGSLVEARRAFERMAHHTTVSWTVLMAGCVENGENAMALNLLARMEDSRVAPDARTFVAAVKACSGLAVREEGKSFDHGKLVKVAALERGACVHSHAGSMYARCGSTVDARRVFERMELRDLAAWNAMMLGYVENGEPDLCLDLFGRMVEARVEPDGLSFVAALKACSSLSDNKVLSLGKCVALHSQAAKSGFLSDIFVASTLVNCYIRCGSIDDAEKIFEVDTKRRH